MRAIKSAMAVAGLDQAGAPMLVVSLDFGEIDQNSSWSLRMEDPHPDDPELDVRHSFSGLEIRRLKWAARIALEERDRLAAMLRTLPDDKALAALRTRAEELRQLHPAVRIIERPPPERRQG